MWGVLTLSGGKTKVEGEEHEETRGRELTCTTAQQVVLPLTSHPIHYIVVLACLRE